MSEQDMEAAREYVDEFGELKSTMLNLHEAIATAIAQARVDAERDTAKRVSEEADKRMASLQSEVATTRLHWKEAAKLLATDEAASLGFSANQAAAVATLLRDRDALAAQVEKMREALEAARHSGYSGVSKKVFCPLCGRHLDEAHNEDECLIAAALAMTPAASLIAHDNALIERCAAVCDDNAKGCYECVGCHTVDADDVRALKTDSEGSTT